jgi:hypothetical protein
MHVPRAETPKRTSVHATITVSEAGQSVSKSFTAKTT